MAHHAPPDVWSQMNYVPPRGQCNFKPSIMSNKCPCLRFMLHPLKSSSSYECDGCAHHASFHSMENKLEDDVRKRWELEAKEKQQQEDREIARPRKRLRELGFGVGSASASNGRLIGLRPLETDEEMLDMSTASAGTGKAKPKKKKAAAPARGAATRARGKVSEILDEDEYDDVVEVD